MMQPATTSATQQILLPSGSMGPAPDARQWKRVREILEAALELPADQRSSYVRAEAGGDGEILDEVHSLLERVDATATFIDHSPAGATETASISRELQAGHQLGHYEIVERIGAGGMGVVYLARDGRLDRLAALKVLNARHESDDERRRFAREARAASALTHPNIITIYEFGHAGEIDYIAMEYIRGRTLAELLKQDPPPLAELLEIARQTALALASAHAAGIVHRDLKPANIMITEGGAIKVLDFGIAKVTSTSGEQSTEQNLILGTPTYMALEVAIGQAADRRADIFALGVILYEMTAKRRPFQGKNAMTTLSQVMNQHPPRVETINPAAPRQLGDLIERCLVKDRNARLGSMEEIAEQLNEIVAPAPRMSRRWLLAGGSAVAAGALTYGVSHWMTASREPLLRFEIEAQKNPALLPYRAVVTDTFQAGWKFRLRLSAARPGYFYALTETTAEVAVVYPLSGQQAEPVAATLTGWYVFDQSPGIERIWVVWAEKPQDFLAEPGRAEGVREARVRQLLQQLPTGVSGMAGQLLQLRHQ
jgi:predicted Ser/Thr protein kinase